MAIKAASRHNIVRRRTAAHMGSSYSRRILQKAPPDCSKANSIDNDTRQKSQHATEPVAIATIPGKIVVAKGETEKDGSIIKARPTTKHAVLCFA